MYTNRVLFFSDNHINRIIAIYLFKYMYTSMLDHTDQFLDKFTCLAEIISISYQNHN